MFFGQKPLNISARCSSCIRKSPIMKWANALKESSKKDSLEPNAASHNNASWCSDTDGFLEHSPIREAWTTRDLPSRRQFQFWGVPSLLWRWQILLVKLCLIFNKFPLGPLFFFKASFKIRDFDVMILWGWGAHQALTFSFINSVCRLMAVSLF